MTFRNRPGLTLLETLLSLALFIGLILGGLDFFSRARRMFFRLSAGQDASERIQSALDKIRLDVLDAGKGLSEPIRLDVLQPIEPSIDGPIFRSADQEISLAAGIAAGTETILLSSGDGFSAGQEICLLDRTKGEICSILSVQGSAIRLAAGPRGDYAPGEAKLILLHRVVFPWAPGERILRRKVNAASAQPLLEDVAAFRCDYDAPSNLARIGLRLTDDPENEYAVTIYPKNAALARAAQTP